MYGVREDRLLLFCEIFLWLMDFGSARRQYRRWGFNNEKLFCVNTFPFFGPARVLLYCEVANIALHFALAHFHDLDLALCHIRWSGSWYIAQSFHDGLAG